MEIMAFLIVILLAIIASALLFGGHATLVGIGVIFGFIVGCLFLLFLFSRLLVMFDVSYKEPDVDRSVGGTIALNVFIAIIMAAVYFGTPYLLH